MTPGSESAFTLKWLHKLRQQLFPWVITWALLLCVVVVLLVYLILGVLLMLVEPLWGTRTLAVGSSKGWSIGGKRK